MSNDVTSIIGGVGVFPYDVFAVDQSDPADEAGTRIYAHRVYAHVGYESTEATPVTVMTDGKNFLSLAIGDREAFMDREVARKIAAALTGAVVYLDTKSND